MRLFRFAVAVGLAVSALLYFVFTWHWPLAGDASLIHYIAFLIERGWAPYRGLGDMNMPGSYLIELAAMRLFGPGALAWRLFDFSLVLAASAAIFSILGEDPPGGRSFPDLSETAGSGAPHKASQSRLAPLFAASLFLLLHGRDGLAQGGQRDLTIAVCLLAAAAFLLRSLCRPCSPGAAFFFGLFSGIGFTIKPTTALLTAAQFGLAARTLRDHSLPDATRSRLGRKFAAAVAGYALAPAICLVFLLREHALSAFLAGFHGIVPYYASLGHRPLAYILLHSLSPVLSLVLLWLAVLALTRPPLLRPHLDVPRALLLLGVLFGLLNCIVQARALPYYRYPLLAFLLPLMALDFTRAARNSSPPSLRTRAAGVFALAALAVGGLFLAPQSAILIHRYRWRQTDLLTSLEQSLTALGGARLSGHIQCIDSVSGCNTVLYRMRLEPSTGVLSDFLLFGNPPIDPETVPIVRQTRAAFSAALLAHPPEVIVVTSHLHMEGPDGYLKLDRWPAFAQWLAANYTLATVWTPTRTERWWSREELPAGYRIYRLDPARGSHPRRAAPHP